jgi:hypothetical protein
MFGPEKVVVAVPAARAFERHIRSAYRPQVFGAAGSSPLLVRPLSGEAWARGAAAVAIQDLFAPRRGPGAG